MINVDLSVAAALRKSGGIISLMPMGDSIYFGTNIKQEPFTLLTLTDDQRFAIERAKKYALEQSIQNALSKQAAQLHQQDLNTIKRNQALILLSRIYVGSISFEIGEEEIRKTFSPFGPIKSVALSWDTVLQKHKGFAFVEFEVPEAASLALDQMNGYTLAGRNLKVGRPSNAPQTAALEAELRAEVSTKPRVYIASVHPELTESDIQTVFEAFGKVNSCSLYPDPKCSGRHRGFGYIDFESEEAAIAAVSSMNCFDLAGQQLRVGRALTPKGVPLPFELNANKSLNTISTNPISTSAVAFAAASISAKVMTLSAEEISSNSLNGTSYYLHSNYGKETRSDLLHAVNKEVYLTGTHWRVLLLENMVGVNEVDDELQEEVMEECGNYGSVLRVLIHIMTSQDVRIFIQFDRSDDAKAACCALNQRYFAGRVVQARLYDEERFQLHELDD
ncbi:poly(U)-binding-splicing factor PUF60 [Schistosoma bovis]|uniref:Poly(U)-binding-splicing factor PUF60 n=1 Tax=Schistosoma bovis TaxID=6184 RepID=A0A430Q7N7_SCHBO|nr:poly(U)-binding-splicing factor PUF60 [Schistosoma bovis]